MTEKETFQVHTDNDQLFYRKGKSHTVFLFEKNSLTLDLPSFTLVMDDLGGPDGKGENTTNYWQPTWASWRGTLHLKDGVMPDLPRQLSWDMGNKSSKKVRFHLDIYSNNLDKSFLSSDRDGGKVRKLQTLLQTETFALAQQKIKEKRAALTKTEKDEDEAKRLAAGMTKKEWLEEKRKQAADKKLKLNGKHIVSVMENFMSLNKELRAMNEEIERVYALMNGDHTKVIVGNSYWQVEKKLRAARTALQRCVREKTKKK